MTLTAATLLLSAPQFTAADREQIVAGAFAAYARFGQLLEREFAGP